MSDNCNHECGHCGEQGCGDRTQTQEPDFSVPANPLSSVKKVVAVVSGKGGVGKSLTTSLLAAGMSRRGHRCAVLDADITGPSIPKMFGIHDKCTTIEQGIVPLKSRGGIDIMSINLILPNETDAVLWRGPMLGGVVKQFWSDVIWRDIDYMFIDMPPGTGDVPLTVFQSLPVDGIVVVSSPQELVGMIVEKAISMADIMEVPMLGLVENMSYFHCPDNGRDYKIFGESHIDDVARQHALAVLAKMPIDPSIAAACDRGEVEGIPAQWLGGALDVIEKMPNKVKK